MYSIILFLFCLESETQSVIHVGHDTAEPREPVSKRRNSLRSMDWSSQMVSPEWFSIPLRAISIVNKWRLCFRVVRGIYAAKCLNYFTCTCVLSGLHLMCGAILCLKLN